MNVLVSGGSRGLGLGICRALLQRGDRVASFARSATPEVEALAGEFGDAFRFSAADATDSDAMRAVVTGMEQEWGGIDGLVNNAAVGQDALLAHLAPEEVGTLLRINLEAPILLTRAVGRPRRPPRRWWWPRSCASPGRRRACGPGPWCAAGGARAAPAAS